MVNFTNHWKKNTQSEESEEKNSGDIVGGQSHANIQTTKTYKKEKVQNNIFINTEGNILTKFLGNCIQ